MLEKTSAVCLLLIIYMMVFYYRKPHIPIKSTRIFQKLTGVALLVALFDFITIYTVNHRDVVPDLLNLIVHIIYLMSLLGYIFLLFLYMRSFLEMHRRFSKAVKLLQILPFFVSAIGILVSPITYVDGKTTAYSLGPKAYFLYVSCVVYLILIAYYCIRYWEVLDSEKRMAIVVAVPLYVVTATIQIAIPESLIVIVCLTLIMHGLIMSNENIEKYMDEKTAMFNQYSFEMILGEFDFENREMIIGLLCFCKVESKVESNIDWKQNVEVLRNINREIKLHNLQGYRTCENGVVFIAGSKDKAQTVLNEVKENIEKKYGAEGITVETKIISEEGSGSRHDCMQNIIAFCTEIGRRFAYIDYMTHIYNRNALERDIAKLENFEGYYLIADLNDLKIVNDTIGHSTGDELLQKFATLLVTTVGENGKVYRQGGDEFAIIYYAEVDRLVSNLQSKCMEDNQSSNISISYAIGYCRLTDPDFINKADRMMYADKKRKKNRCITTGSVCKIAMGKGNKSTLHILQEG